MAIFSLAAGLTEDATSFLATARRAEQLGFVSLLVPDHPGVTSSPLVSLAAAATVTSTIRLCPYVANVGLRDPLTLASDIATLDVLSSGRAVVGLGAGHTPAEWAAVGLSRPSAADRIARLEAVTDIVLRLLAGQRVTHHGRPVSVIDAELAHPRPVQPAIPLLIGGSNPRLLDLAGSRADIVSLTGLGATLGDGHRHEVRWSADRVDAQIARVMGAAGTRAIDIEVLIQAVVVTDDRAAAAGRIAEGLEGLEPADALEAPYLLFGTIDEMAGQLQRQADRWGITRYAVRADAIDTVAQLIGATTD